MQIQPTISIIMPVYDVEEYLEGCLDSILCQTFTDFELLCVDDCARDSSPAILQKYSKRDERLHIIHNEHNIGAGESRNKGLDIAKGEFCFFIDPDDRLYSPQSLQILFNIAEQYGDELVIGSTVSFNDEKTLPEDMPFTHYYDLMSPAQHGITLEKIPDLLKINSVWNKLYRRSFLTHNNIRFALPRHAEDMNFSLLSTFYARSISVTPEPTLMYRELRYFGAASPQKCIDAAQNLDFQYSFLGKYGNDTLLRAMERKIYTHITFAYQREFMAGCGIGLSLEMLRFFQSLLVQSETPPEYKGSWYEDYFAAIRQGKFFDAFSLVSANDPQFSPFLAGSFVKKTDTELSYDDSPHKTFLTRENEAQNYSVQLHPEWHSQQKKQDRRNIAVSVVVPVYNTAPYLLECLESIRMQSLRNIEIICVNDCSPDNCQNILTEYAAKDSRIKIINRPQNGGLANARNSGIEQSSGEYIYLIDSDDLFYDKDSLLHLYEIAICNASEITIGGTVKWKSSDNSIYLDNHKSYLLDEWRNIDCESNPLVMQSIIACNKLFKRSFLQENDILYFDGDLRRFEDNGFCWKVFMYAQKISVSQKPTYLFRQPEDGDYFLSRIYPHVDYLFIAIDKMFRFFEEHPEFAKRRCFAEAQYSVVLVMGVARHEEHDIPLHERNRLFRKFEKVWGRLPEESFKRLWPEAREAYPLMKKGEYNEAWKVFSTRHFVPSKEAPAQLPPYETRFPAENASQLPLQVNFAFQKQVNAEQAELRQKQIYANLDDIYTSPQWKCVSALRALGFTTPCTNPQFLENPVFQAKEKGYQKEAFPQDVLLQFAKARKSPRNILRRFLKAPFCSEVNYLERHPDFSPEFYWNEVPEAQKSGLSAAEHYVRFGAAQGVSPAPGFDTQNYLLAHPELCLRGQNPYVHALKHTKSSPSNR